MLPSNFKQKALVDLDMLDAMIPEDHPLMRVVRHVDFSFVQEEAASLYASGRGRPSYPPEMLFRMLLLEVWANLSDVQVCQQLRYNLLYRAFCGLEWGDRVPDDTTLVKFRARLGQARFERLFQRVLSALREEGLTGETWAIVDGTKVVADVAMRNTLQLVREGRARVAKEVEAVDPERAEVLRGMAPALQDGQYENRERLLAAEIEQGRKFLDACPEGERGSKLQRVREIYRSILGGDGPKSFTDPDARWGFKRSDEPFFGYKAHLMCDEKGYATAFSVTSGNVDEPSQLPILLAQAKAEGMRARKFTADKGYDTKSVRERVKSEDMRAFIPHRTKPEFPDGFRFLGYRTIRCPKGQVAKGTPHQRGGWTFAFSQRACQRCPLRHQCLKGNERRKRLYHNPERYRQPLGMKGAMRVRKEVERVFGNAKKWHGFARARYRSQAGVTIQSCLTFTVLNLKKAAKEWAT